MTYTEFKDECYLIRNNAIQREQIYTALQVMEKNKYHGLVNVSDPTRDIVQRSKSPDDKLFETIDQYERKKAHYTRKIEQLPRENEVIKNALMDYPGIEGVIVADFFIYGHKMKTIERETNYSIRNCYALINKALKKIYDTTKTRVA